MGPMSENLLKYRGTLKAPEESPDPVTNSAQSSLARTYAGEETLSQLKSDLAKKEETLTQLKLDLAKKEEIAKAAVADLKEARDKLEWAKNKQRAKKFVSDEAAAATMRREFATWMREREAMSRYTSCGGGIMLL